MEFSIMALQQDLGNAGCSPEITVDLKWRMVVEKIWVSTLFEQ